MLVPQAVHSDLQVQLQMELRQVVTIAQQANSQTQMGQAVAPLEQPDLIPQWDRQVVPLSEVMDSESQEKLAMTTIPMALKAEMQLAQARSVGGTDLEEVLQVQTPAQSSVMMELSR